MKTFGLFPFRCPDPGLTGPLNGEDPSLSFSYDKTKMRAEKKLFIS